MAQIVKVYQENKPGCVLVGKVYRDADRNEQGTFSGKWQEWFAEGWFDQLKSRVQLSGENSYVGAMRMNSGVFEYWIGLLAKSGEGIPEGFESVAVPGGSAAVAWIKGKDDAGLYSMHDKCMQAFEERGWKPAKDAWYVEEYVCPRFTNPDERGEVILDYWVTLD